MRFCPNSHLISRTKDAERFNLSGIEGVVRKQNRFGTIWPRLWKRYFSGFLQRENIDISRDPNIESRGVAVVLQGDGHLRPTLNSKTNFGHPIGPAGPVIKIDTDVGPQFGSRRLLRVRKDFIALRHGIFSRLGAALGSPDARKSGIRRDAALLDRDYQGDDLAQQQQALNRAHNDQSLGEVGGALGRDGFAAIWIGGVGVAAGLAGGIVGLGRYGDGRRGWCPWPSCTCWETD